MAYFLHREMECKCRSAACTAVDPDPEFMALLEALRELWGKPLVITSGVRCEVHNTHVGGSPKSMHLDGKAADLRISSAQEGYELATLADKLQFGGIGLYKSWVHVDTGLRRRWASS